MIRKACMAALLGGVAIFSPATSFAETVKVGVIALMSGPYAQYGRNWGEGIKAYQKLHGRSVGGKEVEIVFRDHPDVNPAQAKALALELIIKQRVQYMAGVTFSPDAIAIAQVSQEAKVPLVVIGASSSSILEKSDYVLRTGNTNAQLTVPVAKYANDKGIKRVITMVADYVAGIDAENAFVSNFKAGGGTIMQSIRVPMRTTDFTPYMQAAKLQKPDAIFMFFPGGQPAISAIKAYHDGGLRGAGVRLLGTTEVTEVDLPAMGDTAIGIESGMFYSPQRKSEANEKFLNALKDVAPNTLVGYPHVAAFDAMHVIYKMIEATGGKKDGEKAMAAVKGMKWESPRGLTEFDPQTRDLIQNVYIRTVERDSAGNLYNREHTTYERQRDFGRTP